MKQRNYYIVGNWKMKPADVREAKSIVRKIVKAASSARNVVVAICPPAIFMGDLQSIYKGKKIAFGGQNCHWERVASKTGEISPSQLASVGAQYVILGHSERRAIGETSEEVNKKIHAATKEGLTTVVCIGESQRDRQGAYITHLQKQLRVAFKNVTRPMLKNIIVAYEPLWAIGKSAAEANVQPEQVHEMVILVRKFITETYGATPAKDMRVLYGGSVEVSNCENLLGEGHADGALIGHASIVPTEFSEIIRVVNAMS